MASFTVMARYDQATFTTASPSVTRAAVIIPPRSTAVPSDMAETEPTRRDRHLRCIAEHGRRGWQKRSGYNRRSKAEAAVARWK